MNTTKWLLLNIFFILGWAFVFRFKFENTSIKIIYTSICVINWFIFSYFYLKYKDEKICHN